MRGSSKRRGGSLERKVRGRLGNGNSFASSAEAPNFAGFSDFNADFKVGSARFFDSASAWVRRACSQKLGTAPSERFFNAGFCDVGLFDDGFCDVGLFNDGFCDVGLFNVGLFDAGFCDPGFCDAGLFNAGLFNAGFCDVGLFNVGLFNVGLFNAGLFNAGFCDPGFCDAGLFNAGLFNAGFCDVGLFDVGLFDVGLFDDFFASTSSALSCVEFAVFPIFPKLPISLVFLRQSRSQAALSGRFPSSNAI